MIEWCKHWDFFTQVRSFVNLNSYIREVSDFPKPGILFRDIAPLLRDPMAFSWALQQMQIKLGDLDFDYIAGIESRGFILGASLATQMGKGFLPLRKAGKLPPPLKSISYQLEYGRASLESSLGSGKVVIVDDVLATGGTLTASIDLCQQAGYQVEDVLVLINLSNLNNMTWKGEAIKSLLQY